MTTRKPSSKIDLPSKEQLGELVRPYSDEELELSEEMKAKVEKLMKTLDEYGINYDKFDPDSIPKLDFGKRKAYPNDNQYVHVPGQHDTKKWLQAVSEIYRKEKSGQNRVQAIRQATAGWNIMETFDFLNWIRFHESGDYMKYKFAQLWYENLDMPGYALHIKKDPEPQPEPHITGNEINFAKDTANQDSERRERIEKQRNKIIGRLDSAEKLLRSPDGHLFSGKEFESLLESIYDLKKKIQMVNKISASTRLYEDMIVRQANILHKNGFYKAASMLHSIAQTPGAGGEAAKGTPKPSPIPEPASPGDPSGAGNPGPPSGGAGTPAQPSGNASMPQSENSGQPEISSEGLKGFLNNLESKFNDSGKSDDDLEVIDSDSNDDLLVIEAQAINEPITTSPAPLNPSPVAAPDAPETPDAPATEKPLEVTEDDIPAPAEKNEPINVSTFDATVDNVFANITVDDVVAKLEDLAKIFKVREVPRQLAIVDMMLDSLGLASYFPSLSEAQNKALDSNNYISTRVEDILSKLRGAMVTHDIDLKGQEAPEKPEVAGIKNKLKSDEEKEKARKQMRKDQEVAMMPDTTKETPEVEIEEDLGAPPATPAPAAPKPARPVA
jgi:Predicted membrane protein